MRTALIAFLTVLAFAGAVEARGHHVSTTNDSFYTNASGHRVHRPVHAASAPSGASARCRDGSYSFSEHHRGTCSHHGGVSSWLH